MIEALGGKIIGFIRELGKMSILFYRVITLIFRKPYRTKEIFEQMEFIGVKSTYIILLTGCFAGMAFALQTHYAFSMFGAEGLIGMTVVLALTRELAPVFTGLMVTARAGSSIAAELGTMKVTEQIDALYTMAVNPIKYLVVPRVVAGVIMVPLLYILFSFLGCLGSYLVAVVQLGVNRGDFVSNIEEFVDFADIYNGLIKAAFFGLIITLISCYKGFYAEGGAKGVGNATIQTVVISSVTILISNFCLTALMF